MEATRKLGLRVVDTDTRLALIFCCLADPNAYVGQPARYSASPKGLPMTSPVVVDRGLILDFYSCS